MGLHEHGVDLFEVDRAGLFADGFDQGVGAEVFDGAQGAFGSAQDELDGFVLIVANGIFDCRWTFVGKCGIEQSGEVELLVDVVG